MTTLESIVRNRLNDDIINYQTKMDEYETSDMNLATVLSLFFPIKELRNENGKGYFVFQDSSELRRSIKSFWDRELSIEPQSLLDALKTIKNRLYNDLKKGSK